MLTLLGAVYQFEREMLLERKKEGIAKAKLAGKYKGKPNSIDRKCVLDLLDKGLSIRNVAKELGLSPVSVQKIKFDQKKSNYLSSLTVTKVTLRSFSIKLLMLTLCATMSLT